MSGLLLAIGAHPDDVEIGCGAVLAAATSAGREVVIADATAGEAATHGTVADREKERTRAAQMLGVQDRLSVGLPDTRIGTDPSHVDALVALIRHVAPAIVLAPYVEDRHPDHAALGRLVRSAGFLAGVGHPRARPTRVYHYMVHHDLRPSFVVDVSDTWEQKMDALRCYESQFAPPAPATELARGSFLDVIEARGVYHGSLIGAARGEAFWTPGPVALRSLPDHPGEGYSAFR